MFGHVETGADFSFITFDTSNMSLFIDSVFNFDCLAVVIMFDWVCFNLLLSAPLLVSYSTSVLYDYSIRIVPGVST